MTARLQSHIGCCPPGLLAGCPQGKDFRMGAARLLMPALPDYLPVFYNHTAHPGVWPGGVKPFLCQLDGAGHIVMRMVGHGEKIISPLIQVNSTGSGYPPSRV